MVRLLIIIIFWVWSSEAQARNKYVVDDFSSYEVGHFPSSDKNGWHIFTPIHVIRTKNYVIESEGLNNKFLRSVIPLELDRNHKAVTIIKRVFKTNSDSGKNKVFLNPKDYPILTWRWRVHELPKGSDERVETKEIKRSDSAAGIYVYLQKEGLDPYIMKYVWSETLPEGTRLLSPSSNGSFQAHICVVKSGSKKLGLWETERVNIYDDFKLLFNKEPPRILGIGILTDADSTHTSAKADYDDIVLLK